jgi:hypothetical protein
MGKFFRPSVPREAKLGHDYFEASGLQLKSDEEKAQAKAHSASLRDQRKASRRAKQERRATTATARANAQAVLRSNRLKAKEVRRRSIAS